MQNTHVKLMKALQSIDSRLHTRKKAALSELLRLQNSLYRSLETLPQVRFKQTSSAVQEQPPPSVDPIKISQDIDQILQVVDEQMKQLHQPIKPKIDFKLPPKSQIGKKTQEERKNLPNSKISTTQKKPPIPHFKVKSNAYIPSFAFIPPKNKNEITPKVTQSNPTRKFSSTKIISNKLGQQTRANSVARIPQTKKMIQPTLQHKIDLPSENYYQENTLNTPSIVSTTSTKGIKIDQGVKSSIPKSHFQSKLAFFQKKIENLNGDCQQDANLANELIELFNKETMGYRIKEERSRQLYLKHITQASYAFEHNIESSNFIHNTRQVCKCTFPLEKYEILLDRLECKVNQFAIKEQSDLKIDPKQICNINHYQEIIKKYLDQLSKFRDSIQVPDFVEMTFGFTPKSVQNKQKIAKNQLDFSQLDDQIITITSYLENKEQLSKQDLKIVKDLADIAINDSKHTPVIANLQSFQNWQRKYL